MGCGRPALAASPLYAESVLSKVLESTREKNIACRIVRPKFIWHFQTSFAIQIPRSMRRPAFFEKASAPSDHVRK
jgi:hypothetical protein